MPHTDADVSANREWFAAKLRAERQVLSVANRVAGKPTPDPFLLLDVRPRDAFERGHVRGALSTPSAELGAVASRLPREETLVVYCWNEH